MKEYKFGLEEIKGMLKEMIVLVDSREQKNAHILDYFQRQGIPYEVEKLDYGDYSCNKEESAILQHDNTGVGADAPGIRKHDTRAADSDISDTLKSRECLSDALYGPWTDFRQSKGEQK